MATLVSLESDLTNVKDLVNFLIDRRVPFNRIGSTMSAPFNVASPWLVNTVPPTGDAVFANEPIGHYVINVDTGTVWRKTELDSTLPSSWAEFGQGSSGGSGGIGEWQDSVLQFVYPVVDDAAVDAVATAVAATTYDFRYVFVDSATDITTAAAPNDVTLTAGKIYRISAAAPVLQNDALVHDGKRWIAGASFTQSVVGFDETSGSYATPAALGVTANDIITYTFERDAASSGNDGFLSFDPGTGSFTSIDEAETSSGNNNQIYFYDGSSWNLYVAEETYKIEDVLTPLDTTPDAYLSKPLMSLQRISKVATPPSDKEITVNGVKVLDGSWEALEIDWATAPSYLLDVITTFAGGTTIDLAAPFANKNVFFAGDVIQVTTDAPQTFVAVITNVDFVNDRITIATDSTALAGTITELKKQGLLPASADTVTAHDATNPVVTIGGGPTVVAGDVVLIFDANTNQRHVRVVTDVAGNDVTYSGQQIDTTSFSEIFPVTADYAATTVHANAIAPAYYLSWKTASYVATHSTNVAPVTFAQGYDIETSDDLQIEYFSADKS